MQIEGLTLSRHKDESVVIDLRQWGLGLIHVVVVETRVDKARLVFGADKRIRIDRLEVFEAIERNKAKAVREMTPEFDGCEGP